MDLDLRFGEVADAETIAKVMVEADHDLFRYMLDGIAPGSKMEDLLLMGILDETSPFVFSNALILWRDHQPLALALAFPGSSIHLDDGFFATLRPEHQGELKQIMSPITAECLYLKTLFVAPEARGQGLGAFLLQSVCTIAQQEKLPYVSLHVWEGNEHARRLFEHAGFNRDHHLALPQVANQFESENLVYLKLPVDLATH